VRKSAPSCIKCLILEHGFEHGLHMHFSFQKRKAQQVNQLEEIVIKLVSGGGPLPTLWWIYILLLCTCWTSRSRDVIKKCCVLKEVFRAWTNAPLAAPDEFPAASTCFTCIMLKVRKKVSSWVNQYPFWYLHFLEWGL
jgi:hypothetical protein